jgi:hypothetical protein
MLPHFGWLKPMPAEPLVGSFVTCSSVKNRSRCLNRICVDDGSNLTTQDRQTSLLRMNSFPYRVHLVNVKPREASPSTGRRAALSQVRFRISKNGIRSNCSPVVAASAANRLFLRRTMPEGAETAPPPLRSAQRHGNALMAPSSREENDPISIRNTLTVPRRGGADSGGG